MSNYYLSTWKSYISVKPSGVFCTKAAMKVISTNKAVFFIGALVDYIANVLENYYK